MSLLKKLVNTTEKRKLVLAVLAGYGILSLSVDLAMLGYHSVAWCVS